MILLLTRNRPLNAAEARALPNGCKPVDGTDGVVARADVDLPVAALLGFAVTMGRAVPDAIFVAQESGAPTVVKVPEGVKVAPPEEAKVERDPWRLLDAGKLPEAEKIFTELGEKLPQRERVRGLFTDDNPERAAFGCKLARIAGMRSMAINLRGLLGHGHPDVRAAACTALGALAGPSMAPAVAALQNDPDNEVRTAAIAALAALGG